MFAPMKQAESRVVVAIDFGTTFSGFAFALRKEPNKIYQDYEWPSQGEAFVNYCKTITAVLYEDSSVPQVEAWGWPAYIKGKQTVESAPLYTEKFKLHLAEESDRLGVTLPALPAGKSAELVIADYLLKMFQHALPIIRRVLGADVTEQDIQWCLTVPAIWSDKAKATMKHAAQRAGMINGPLCPLGRGSKHPLLTVLEPEAASLFCHRYFTEEKPVSEAFDKPFMIVDIGGGTVDLVVHEIEPLPDYLKFSREVRLKEKTPGSGGLCGGSVIDQNFLAMMREKLPKKIVDGEPVSVLTVLEKESPKHYWIFMKKWESIKRLFSGTEPNFMIDYPSKLRELIKSCSGRDEDEEEDDDDDESGTTMLSNDDMKKIFDPVVTKIIALINEQLDAAKTCDTIVLVGGFSESVYLKSRLEDTFSKKRVKHFLQPTTPGAAITIGAVYYGLKPAAIVSRCARYSYGIKAARPQTAPATDPPAARFIQGGKTYVWIFEKFVSRGQEIRLDDYERKQYNPMSALQTCVELPILISTAPDVKYATDASVRNLGQLRIPITKVEGMMATIEVRFKFGGTTIEVIARNISRPDEPETVQEIPYI